MRILTIFVIALTLALGIGSYATLAQNPAPFSSDAPRFTEDGKLEFPENYREWIYLTSGSSRGTPACHQIGRAHV